MEFVGRKVAKKFPGYGSKKFKGEVISVEEDGDARLFKIRYEDEDEEEVDEKELKRILVGGAATSGKQSGAASTGKKRKAAGEEPPEPSPEAQGAPQPEADAGPKTVPKAEVAVQAGDDAADEAAGRPGTSSAAAGPSKQQQAGVRSSSRGGAASKAAAAAQPSLQTEVPRSVDEQQLHAMVEEVAVKSKALEVGLVRHTYPDGQPATAEGVPRSSRAVTCGGLCFTSALLPLAGTEHPDDAPDSVIDKEYETQTADVLAQLDEALREVGSSKDHLLSCTVFLKDIGRMAGFTTAYNRWCSLRALPALSVHESYLGTEAMLVSVSATAVVPAQQYA